MDEHVDRHFNVCKDLQQVVRLFVGLCQQAQRYRGNGVVAPGPEERDEEGLAVPCIPRPQFLPKIRQLRRGDQVVIQILHHDARELDVFVFFKAVGHCTVDALGAEIDAELADDQVAAGFEEAAVGAEELQEVDHEEGEVGVVAVFGDLGEELEIACDDGVGGVGEGFEESREGAVVGGEGLGCVSMVLIIA